ncbi:hypothetical protein ENUP19_0061G0139 [Entamoeba nuttalli]|uniref:Uncharacterized protein n=2 Tax=Entamoeba nuttalli TaxID=412467 RepID=K2I0F6_ENTNP|nr:hypothetical protein ENU1_027890 [Entamoeba nuttalli P19]EKE42230.1 hypothetical protein ENU1_027890 [Entamoeba nuttalli P19]|eukprot:XP_008855432.1 hypothetical protein ENU1_027890 [Entamoeba nuttalli P19]
MTTNITEIIPLSESNQLIIYSNKRASVINISTTEITCNVDLSENTVLTSFHKTSQYQGNLCVVSMSGTEFYTCKEGVLEYIGMVPQGTECNGQVFTFTDCSMQENQVVFSTTDGSVLFFEYSTLDQQAIIPLIQNCIETIEYTQNNGMLYVIDTNGTFFSLEINKTLFTIKRCYAKEDLHSFIPIFDSKKVQLIPTPNGCLLLINGNVLEYIKDIPSLYLYTISDAQHACSINGKTYVCTLNGLYVFTQCDNESIQSFKLTSPTPAIKTLIQPPQVVIFTLDSVHLTQLPVVHSRQTINAHKQLPINYKLSRMSHEYTLINLVFGSGKSLYGIDSNGNIFYSPNINQQETTLFGKINVYQPGYALSYILPNKLYGVFGMGESLEVAHLETHQHVTTAYLSSDKKPDECITCIDGNKIDQSVFAVGFYNGMVATINTEKVLFKTLYSHSHRVVTIKYIDNIIASLDEDGNFIMEDNQGKIANNPISFDVFGMMLLVVETNSVQLISLNDLSVVASWEISSNIIDAKFSCDGMHVVVVSKERIVILKSSDLGVLNYISVNSMLSTLKLNAEVHCMTISKEVPCQFAVSLTGGYYILIEPKNYKEWKY